MTLMYDSTTLPVLAACDVVIVDGSLAGVTAALTLAQCGLRVTLIEARTYLGWDITATLRPWVCTPANTADTLFPELLVGCITASKAHAVDGEYALHNDAVKLYLEDQLLNAGVKLLYACLPIDVVFHPEGGVSALVIGNKSGRQAVHCHAIFDTSATAITARLAGATFGTTDDQSNTCSYTLEFDGIATAQTVLAQQEALQDDAGDARLLFHRGYRGPEHLLVECSFPDQGGAATAMTMTRRDVYARQRAMQIAMQLLTHDTRFHGAYLSALSLELHGPLSPPLTEPLAPWAQPLATTEILPPTVDQHWPPIAASDFTGQHMGMWAMYPTTRADVQVATLLNDPITACQLGMQVARALVSAMPFERLTHSNRAVVATNGDVSLGNMSAFCIKELTSPQRGRGYERDQVPAMPVPVLASYDVLVVGGGTSGATAATVAARYGAHTALIDMNPGLGGTGTYGGVHSYWFGRRTGFSGQLSSLLAEMHIAFGHQQPAGDIPKWNIEIKAYTLLQELDDARVNLLLNSFVIGTVVAGSTVQGVVVATRAGPYAILGSVVIDATGDGDVAAHAGAAYVYGDERDHTVMWYSLAQFGLPGRTRNNFTSMVDISNIEDYTRAILAGRRRGPAHDHGIYLAPRESRHIRADLVLTHTDQLLQRCWPDVINITFSNHDIKGHSGSDWVRIGLIPPNLEVEIPYRALLPSDLENILVVGKAISATHDALPAIRMQPDLENLGGVAGIAAALATLQGISPRAVDIRVLQAHLVQVGLLPASVIERQLQPWRPSNAELMKLADQLTGEHPLYVYSDMELNEVYHGRIPLVDLCCAGPEALPILERALAVATGARQILLAQALALLGSQTGSTILVDTILSLIGGEELPPQTADIRHSIAPPDQGAMPDPAYLLYALGMTRDLRALPVWQQVVEQLARISDADLRHRRKGVFYYVDAICYGAERLGNPAAIPLLCQLHSYAPLQHRVCRNGFQTDFFEERHAYLELVIGRALARCGSCSGLDILIGYLDDVRALLAEHAHTELQAITGCDYGKDSNAWYQWLAQNANNLLPCPWPSAPDPVATWNEDILVPA